MKLPAFKLEEFWKKHEFTAPYLLCCSDTETWKLNEILTLADAETKELWDNLSLEYTEPPGHPLLRKEIANLYTSIQDEQVLTLAGAEEGIYCTMRTLLSPGDHVLVIDPCYQSLETLPQSFGATITKVHLDFKKNWKFSLADLQKAFRPETKLLILNYPHNPTGTLLEKETFEGIIELARKRGTYIFSDEVYRYLEVDEQKRLPSFADVYEKGIALNVMTKSFGLAGLRIGWLATQERELLQSIGSYKLYTSICNSAPSEILSLMALRARDFILGRNREILLNNLQILDEFMARHRSKLRWVRPESGTMATIQLLLPVPVEQFAEELVEKTGVLIMPGTVYDLPGNCFRIGFGRKNMPAVLEKFQEFLTAY